MKTLQHWFDTRKGRLADKTDADRSPSKDFYAAIQLDAITEGLTRFAWWKDGVQYVGSCGTTLKDAIEEARKEIQGQL